MTDPDRVHEFLPLYLAGRLGREDLERFERHMESCDDCNDERRFMTGVASGVDRHGPEFLNDHPPAEALVAYANLELAGDERSAVERHLAMCSTCSVEMRWISGDEVAAGAVATRPPVSRWARAWVPAAIAAAFVLGLFLPALFDRGAAPPSFPRPQFIARVERAGTGPTRIKATHEDLRFNAYFPVDLPPAEFPCTIEIASRDGRVVAGTRIAGPQDLVAGQFLFFECDLTDCPAGGYTVQVRASDGTPRESIPFEVVAR